MMIFLALIGLSQAFAAPSEKYACLGEEDFNGKRSRVFFTVTFSDFLRGEGYTEKIVELRKTQSGYSILEVEELRKGNITESCHRHFLDELSSTDRNGTSRFTYRQTKCASKEVFSFTGKCRKTFN